MATATLRPNSTTSNTGALTGGATAHAVLSDNSDASYVEIEAGETFNVGFGDLTLPAGAVIKRLAVRVRIGLEDPFPSQVDWDTGITGLSGSTLVTWGPATTVTLGMLTQAGISDAHADGIALTMTTNAGYAAGEVYVYEAYVDVTYVAVPTLVVDAPTGTVTDTNQPTTIWTPEATTMVRLDATRRTPGDCMRTAATLTYGVPYDSTPAIDPTAGTFAQQLDAWQAWAARQRPRAKWWLSDTHSPISASRWIAIVDSPGGPANHAVVMQHDRLYADPANHYSSIALRDVRCAWMLLPVDSPVWAAPQIMRFAPITNPYRADGKSSRLPR